MSISQALNGAKAFVAITARLAQRTGRPGRAAALALGAVRGGTRPVELQWKGFRLAARGVDWFALSEVLLDAEYDALRPLLSALERPVVLDLGANVGMFALYVLSVAPKARVHSYEPGAGSFGLLRANAARNPGHEWTAWHGAVWESDGEIGLASAARSTASHVVAEGGNERVPAASLATVLARAGGRADLAKIDIEGAEEAVLAAGRGALASIDSMVIEIHPDRCSERNVVAILRAAYPRLYRIPGRKSSKPLLLATRTAVDLALPVYEG